ncbi:MAG: 3-oxoacid CoA-transferase subunit B [Pseudomonadota bacterium]|nr:3-oxoacid CoA-transferase subunit B [Pseudomonadota bacterium]
MTEILSREQVAWRLAQDIGDGSYVNLGIGMPEIVANYIPDGREIVFHSENGILGMGPEPAAIEIEYDLINAGKKPVTILPGGAFFHHADSFGMIRGGHIDICVLGAFQVSAKGDLANWSTGGPDAVPSVGGAMDLALGAQRVLVMTDHNTKNGDFKIVEECTYPPTGLGVVGTVCTDIAVIDISADGPVVREKVSGLSFDDLQSRTGARLLGVESCGELKVPVLD